MELESDGSDHESEDEDFIDDVNGKLFERCPKCE